MVILTKIYDTVETIVIRLLGLLELFLFLRFILKFFNASSKALVVDFIYKWSSILVSPFDFIFPDIHLPKGYFIETSTLSAMVGYAILVYVIFRLLRLFSRD